MNSLTEQARAAHAQNLGTMGSGGVEELISMLTDPSWTVRRIVSRSLSAIGEPAVQPLCQALIHQRDNEARIAAIVDTLVTVEVDMDSALSFLANHPDPAVVADAAQIFGRRRDLSAVPILMKLTKHSDDNVAVGAIEALGRIGSNLAVEALIDSINTGNFFRVFPAIDVLGRSGDPRAIEPLAKLLENPSYLPEAARALGKTGARAAAKPLLKILNSPFDSVVRVAAVSLADLREKYDEKSGGEVIVLDSLIKNEAPPETVRKLIRILSHADISESVSICRLLGVLGQAEAASALTSALDSVGPIALAAAEALKRIGKDIDEVLFAAIRDGGSQRRKAILPIISRSSGISDVTLCLIDSDPEVRAMACEVLSRLGSGSVVAQIFPLLSDRNMRVVHAATAAIQALGTRQARELAVESTKSVNPVVRRAALRILSYFGDDLAAQPIITALKDEDPTVREVAIQGLPYLDGPEGLNALFEIALNPHPKTRAIAMRSLGMVSQSSDKAVTILTNALSDPDSWVRYYACQALGRIKCELATSQIVQLLEDPAGQVRVSAVEALSHLKSPEAHSALRKAALSDEVEIQRAALVGLGLTHQPEDLPAVLKGLNTNDASTKLMAISALAHFTSTSAVEALSAAALDADEQVSSTAINLLADRSEPEATKVLVSMMSSVSARERAASALRANAKGRLAGLLEVLETSNDDVAPQLISVIMRMERAEAKAGLLSAFHSNNVAARKAAATGLAARREPEMISALQLAAKVDKDAEVRKICSLLLHE